jgi:hypothetical protein
MIDIYSRGPEGNTGNRADYAKQLIATKSLHLFELHVFHLTLSYAFTWNASTITSNALLTI